MYEFEEALAEKGFSALCGVDEAGCGPLAGPVYAAAVILDPVDRIDGLNDSKKLSEKKRELLFPEIQTRASAWAIALASVEEIDRMNILQARLLAMRRAISALEQRPDYILVDGNRDPQPEEAPTLLIVKGDARSASIAAASILAKVARDHAMLALDAEYPQYAFAKNKGYPTRLHRERILQYGPCPAHRRTFLKKLLSGETP